MNLTKLLYGFLLMTVIIFFSNCVGNGVPSDDKPTQKTVFSIIKSEACEHMNGDLYLYDPDTDELTAVKSSCNNTNGCKINPDTTLIVFAEGSSPSVEGVRAVKIFDISDGVTTIVPNISAYMNAEFNEDGDILYVDYNDRQLKKANISGADISTISEPGLGYDYSLFRTSPDYSKILILGMEGENYKLLIMDSDGSNRKEVIEFSDLWHIVSWNPGSNRFFIYFEEDSSHKYYVGQISDNENNFTLTNLSNSYLGKENNLLSFTISNKDTILEYIDFFQVSFPFFCSFYCLI